MAQVSIKSKLKIKVTINNKSYDYLCKFNVM